MPRHYTGRIIKFIAVKLFLLAGMCVFAFGNTKSTSLSGNWTNPEIWSNSILPGSNEDVTISAGQNIVVDSDITVKNLTISSTSTLTWVAGKRLTINGNFIVNGNVNLNGGLISLGSPGLGFTLGPGATFVWDPGVNTSTEATLFTRGTENFSPTSTLIIKKWYNYSVALGSVVTGNFGHLVLNSLVGASTIVEWNQNNQFETHKILGTLTIDQAWITLDKSGSISHTILSDVILTSVNSYLYGHNGNHPGSFKLTSGNITNTGGSLIALNDGTGDVTLEVNGNFLNRGNVKVIMNSGIAGAGNGNAEIKVAGIYTQITGDTRFIYNVSSLNSGVYNAQFGGIELTGGIFMGQTGCHSGNGTCSLSVTNNLNVSFTNSTDKFRGTSLSNIGTNFNSTRFILQVGKNLNFTGPSNSEFTTSASTGFEKISVIGNLQTGGGTFSINYGTSAAAHQSETVIGGNIVVSGGSTFLTRNSGSSTISIGGDLQATNGILILKGSTGSVSASVHGNFVQQGGTIYLHGNSALLSPDLIQLNVFGNFTQTAGTFSFDDNIAEGNATHQLNIQGNIFSISGTGIITRGSAGTLNTFGLIRFSKAGEILYQRTNGHKLQQVQLEVASACTLSLSSGNIQLSSHTLASTDFLTVRSNALLKLNQGQIRSDEQFTHSGMFIDSAGTLAIGLPAGLYNESGTAALHHSGNMNYSLHAHSIIEYTGSVDQTVTGTNYAITSSPQHRYGILRISKTNNTHTLLGDNYTRARTRLELVSGQFNLNGKTFILENGKPDAISRGTGYIYAEDDNSVLTWTNITSGLHEFPFGTNANTYIPVIFTPTFGFGNSVSISTRGTPNRDNSPLPSNLLSFVLGLLGLGYAENEVIDRWWKVSATGMTADVTLNYPSTENTLRLANRLGPLGLRSYDGTSWSSPRGFGFGILAGIGSVTITNVSQFSNWILASNNTALPVELSLFQANAFKENVRIDWITNVEINNDFFTLERSSDGENFDELIRIAGAGNSNELNTYQYVDQNPLSGRSYYRLKQTDFDGQFTYSEIKTVHFDGLHKAGLTIESISPNPFEESFSIQYSIGVSAEINIMLTHSSGKLVNTMRINARKGKNTFDYNEGGNLQPGAYILQLVSGNESVSKKLIKK